MEDWAYAASWEGTPPINPCSTHTYKNYPLDRTQYTPKGDDGPNIATLIYLVETDNSKMPPQATLGSRPELWQMPNQAGAEHVPRNIRLALKLAELIEPALRVAADGRLVGFFGRAEIISSCVV